MNSHASWDLDWNKSSDIDFDIKFTINPDTLEKKALLRFRRISIDGKPGEWTYAGYDSWKMFSKEQKCKLQQDLKEYGSMLSKFSKCDDFIKLIEESLYPNDYVSVDYLMIGKLLGLTSALNEKKIKFDGREILGETCGKNKLHSTLLSANAPEIVGPFPKERFTFKKPPIGMCPYLNWKEYRKDIREGMKGNFSSTQYFNKIYAFTNEHISDLISLVLINNAHAAEEQSYDSFVCNSESGTEDPILANFSEVAAFRIGYSAKSASEIVDYCSGECRKNKYAEFYAGALICDKDLTNKYQIAMSKLEEKYKGDKETYRKLSKKLNSEYQKVSDRAKELGKALLNAKETGDTDQLLEFIDENQESIVEANLDIQGHEMKQYLDLENQKSEIETKQKIGEKISEEEVNLLNKEYTNEIGYIDSGNGKEIKSQTYSRKDFYQLEQAVKAESTDDNFNSSVLDYSDTKPGSIVRLQKVSSRIVLEGQRRGINISPEKANDWARKYLNEEKVIINFDRLFGKKAATVISDRERDFLERTLSTNEDISRVDLIKSAMNRSDKDSSQFIALKKELEMLTEKANDKTDIVNSIVENNEHLGRIIPDNKKDVNEIAVNNKSDTKIENRPLKNSNKYHSKYSETKFVKVQNTPDSKQVSSKSNSGDVDEITTNTNFEMKSTNDVNTSSNDDDPSLSDNVKDNVTPLSNSKPNEKHGLKNVIAPAKVTYAKAGTGSASSGGGIFGGGPVDNDFVSNKRAYNSTSLVGSEEKMAKYEDSIETIARKGIKEVGKNKLKELLEKYYLGNKDSHPVISEKLFKNDPNIIRYVVSTTLYSSGKSTKFYIKSENSDNIEGFIYGQTEFESEDNGTISRRLNLSGKMDVIKKLMSYGEENG